MNMHFNDVMCCLILDFMLKRLNICYDLCLIAMPICCLVFVTALFDDDMLCHD